MSNVERSNQLQERLIRFSVRIVNLVDSLPSGRAASHFGRQLLRCGTAPAPNYAEARGAESREDFIHKLKVALKELNESTVWLKMIRQSGMLQAHQLSDLLDETEQLCRIVNASISTAKARSNGRQNGDASPSAD